MFLQSVACCFKSDRRLSEENLVPRIMVLRRLCSKPTREQSYLNQLGRSIGLELLRSWVHLSSEHER